MTYDLKERTRKFAYDCIKLATAISKNDLGDIVRKQLLRAATSVAANYRAAYIAPTRKAFGQKLSICAEEADECNFWLILIIDQGYRLLSDSREAHKLSDEATELTRIFVASRKTIAKDPPC